MRNGIFSVARLETGFSPAPWDFARDEAARIDAHWRERLAEKPKLFDGRVLLLRNGEILDSPEGILFRGAFFETDFRNFLAWRDFGFPDREVFNCFSMAALRSNDGAWLLGEMGQHTAGAGKIYFRRRHAGPRRYFRRSGRSRRQRGARNGRGNGIFAQGSAGLARLAAGGGRTKYRLHAGAASVDDR